MNCTAPAVSPATSHAARWLRALALSALAGTLLGLAGCASAARGGPTNFAGVIIENHTTDEIRQAAVDVFTSNYYVTKLSGTDILVFEKMGSGMDNLAYGGWSPNEVSIRVKVYLTPASDIAYIVSCDAFMVRNAGDGVFEDEQRLLKIRRGPYQRLLEEVKSRLEHPAP